MTVRGLAFGRPEILKRLGYKNALVDRTAAALNEAPELMEPFRAQIRQAGKNGPLPALVHSRNSKPFGGRHISLG